MEKVDFYAKKIWEYMLMHQELQHVDAIFALGSNDIRVAERAAELYQQGYAPLVICAGGFGKRTQFDKPEAEVFKEILLRKGVPEKDILIENKSSNTGENILFVKKLLEEKALTLASFLLVQKPYMERRTYATFLKQWTGVECIVTSPQLSYESYWNGEPEFRDKFVNVMVGDLLRIKEYPKLGFQIEQEIPEDVWEAGQKLLAMGFDKYKI